MVGFAGLRFAFGFVRAVLINDNVAFQIETGLFNFREGVIFSA